MSDLERTSPLEVRAAGRTLTGEAVHYGEQATDRPERFEPGAFAPLGDVHLNLQHDRSITLASTGDRLSLRDTPRALEVRAELADGAALTLLRRGGLRGLSVEFRSLSERRDDGMRVIERAKLEAIGLVDTGSYAGRLELRRRGGGGWGGGWSGRSMRAKIPAGEKVRCECGGNALCKWAEIIPDAMEEMFDEAFEAYVAEEIAKVEGRAAREVIAVWNNYASPLASVAKGTLRRTGQYEVEIDLPDDDNGRAVLAAHEAAGVIVRPHLDMNESEYVQDGDTLHYSKARVRAFIVSATDAREGWPTPTITETGQAPEPEERRHRRRLWL